MWPFGGGGGRKGGGGGGRAAPPEATETLLIRDDEEATTDPSTSPSADAWGSAPVPADSTTTTPFELPPSINDADSLTDGERRRRAALAEDEGDTSSSPNSKPPRAASYAFAALNVLTSCAAVAIAKQMLNPDTLRSAASASSSPEPPSARTPAPPTAVPPWFRDTYTQWAAGEAGRAAVRRVAKDTAVLAGASGVWYAAEWGLRAARGGKDDPVNPAVAGGLGAGLIGLAFFGDASARASSLASSAAVRDALRRRVLVRAGLWAAAGAALGAWGHGEAQKARGAMLRRQQELEKKHLGTQEDQVATELSGPLLRKLARMEEAERQRQRLQQQQQQQGSEEATAAPPLGPPPPGGYTREEEERRWRQLMDNPPWVASPQPPTSDR